MVASLASRHTDSPDADEREAVVRGELRLPVLLLARGLRPWRTHRALELLDFKIILSSEADRSWQSRSVHRRLLDAVVVGENEGCPRSLVTWRLPLAIEGTRGCSTLYCSGYDRKTSPCLLVLVGILQKTPQSFTFIIR